jgi:hypothetical protein
MESEPIVHAAHDIAGYLAAHGAGIELYNDVPKWLVEDGGARYFQVPRLDISLVLPADVNSQRYRPLPRRHTTRPQRERVVQHWVYASASDATTTVAVARLESGSDDEWTAHIGRGPLTQYLDKFSVNVKAALASGVAPAAAHIALLAADVVMPLQAELVRLCGGGKR